MTELEASGYLTHYLVDDFTPPWAPRDTIVVQHGFGRNANFWFAWVPRLAGQFRFVRRDLRGHGGSTSAPSLPWSFDQLVDDMETFCAALDLGPVHLIGESTGGMLSVGLAHRYPERVKTLTLCNAPTTIGAAGQAFFAGEHASWQEAMEALGARGWVEWLISQPGTSIADFPEERAWILDQMSRTALDAMIGYSHVISRTDVAPLLPELSMPVLVLAPTRSSAAPLEGQHKMAEAIPNCRIAEIDARGHEVYWDRPDECIAALREHMSAAR